IFLEVRVRPDGDADLALHRDPAYPRTLPRPLTMTDSAAEEILRERRRLTDRIIGLTYAQLDGATRADGVTPARRTRRDEISATIQQLADLGARSESRDARVVPDAGDRVLADQLAVMIDDVLVSGSIDELAEC